MKLKCKCHIKRYATRLQGPNSRLVVIQSFKRFIILFLTQRFNTVLTDVCPRQYPKSYKSRFSVSTLFPYFSFYCHPPKKSLPFRVSDKNAYISFSVKVTCSVNRTIHGLIGLRTCASHCVSGNTALNSHASSTALTSDWSGS